MQQRYTQYENNALQKTKTSPRLYRYHHPNIPPPMERLPDECSLRTMSNPEFFAHIKRCQKTHCRERLENHLDVMFAYGVEIPPELDRSGRFRTR
jgi:hypothetical protein